MDLEVPPPLFHFLQTEEALCSLSRFGGGKGDDDDDQVSVCGVPTPECVKDDSWERREVTRDNRVPKGEDEMAEEHRRGA